MDPPSARRPGFGGPRGEGSPWRRAGAPGLAGRREAEDGPLAADVGCGERLSRTGGSGGGGGDTGAVEGSRQTAASSSMSGAAWTGGEDTPDAFGVGSGLFVGVDRSTVCFISYRVSF